MKINDRWTKFWEKLTGFGVEDIEVKFYKHNKHKRHALWIRHAIDPFTGAIYA